MSGHRLTTTVVGSFPARPRGRDFERSYNIDVGRMTSMEDAAQDQGSSIDPDPFKKSLEDSIQAQLEAGIDIISDGQTRNDMVTLFASKLNGIRMKTRPVVIGDVSFDSPITHDDLLYARSLVGDNVRIKGIVTGAYTMARSCVDEHYGNVENLAFDIAESLSKEVEAISDIVDIIQVDEPFFSIDRPEYGKDLVEIVLKNTNVDKALHVCGDIKPLFEDLIEIDVDILDHEFAAHTGLDDFVSGYDFPHKLGFGCVRSDVNEAESVDKIKERILKGLDLFSEDKLLLDPDCGLRNLDQKVACQKLRNMVEARDLVEKELMITK